MNIKKFDVFYSMVVTFCILTTTACVKIQQLQQVEEDKRVAIEQRNEQRNIALSRHLAWEARSFIKERPDLALLLAVEACDTADTTEARASLLEALQLHPPIVRYLRSHTGPVGKLVFGAGGVLAFSGHDGKAGLNFWDSVSGKPINEPFKPGIWVLAASRDGNILASGIEHEIKLWDFRSQELLHPPLETELSLDSLALGPDGTLAVAGNWGELQLWDSKTGKPLTDPVQAHDAWTHHEFIGGVFLSSNNGTSWQAVNSGLTNMLIRCLVVNENNLFVGTYGGGVYHSTNNGSSWKAVNSGLINKDVQTLAVSGENLFAGTGYGGVFLSSNSGKSWKAVNYGLPVETGVNCLVVNGSKIFAGTDRGVFLSINNGTSWKAVNSGLTGTIVNCLAVNGENLFAGITKIEGVGFDTLQEPEKKDELVVVGQDPVYIGEGVFLSTDNGKSWITINSGLPAETEVYCFMVSDSKFFAGTDRGVFLSTNSGESWKAMNSGLTDVCVKALVASGKNIFAGAEYGGVFLSTNNGTSWKMVNTGLPEDAEEYCFVVSDNKIFVGIDSNLGSQSNSINDLVFSPDGETLLTGASDGIIHRWEGKSLERIADPIVAHIKGVAGLVFHPDGKTLASCGSEGEIRLWDWPDMKPVCQPIRPDPNRTFPSRELLAYTPDGVLLSTPFYERGPIRKWNGKTLDSLGQLTSIPQGRILTLAVRDDGMVATGGLDGTVMLWDLKHANPLLLAIPAHADNGIVFTGDDQLAAADEHGVLRCWSILERKVVREVQVAGEHEIWGLAVSELGRLAVGLDNGSVLFFDLETGNLSSPVSANNGAINGLAFNPVGDRLATGSYIPGSLRIIDPESHAPVTPLANAWLGYLWDIAFSPDGKVLAASGQYGTIRLFDADNLRPITLPLPVHEAWGMNFLTYSPDGRLVVAGGYVPSLNNIIQFRDGTTGQPIGPAIGTPPVSKLVFSSDGKLLAGGGFDGTIRLWDGKTLQSLGVLTGYEDYVVRYLKANAGGRIAAAYDNGNVEIWDIDITSWKKKARWLAGRELTADEQERFLGVIKDGDKK